MGRHRTFRLRPWHDGRVNPIGRHTSNGPVSPWSIGLLIILAVTLTVSGCSTGVRAGRYDSPLSSLPSTSAPKISDVATETAIGATLASPTPKTSPMRTLASDFPLDSAMEHIRTLTSRIGTRPGGSEAEARAARYIERELRDMGYRPVVETFVLPNGNTSSNIVVEIPGSVASRLVLGAHHDTKSTTPGGNDNASGVGALLAIAQSLKSTKVVPTLELVFFGTEEFIAPSSNGKDWHHLGSRHRFAQTSAENRRLTAGMISIDMIGYGSSYHVRTMRRGPMTLADDLIEFASERRVRLTFLKDPGRTGWSDHEPYEVAGIPALWLQWQKDPHYHGPGDDFDHVSREDVRVGGQLVLDYTRALTETDLKALRK